MTILITGAASGIGRATALAYARQGARLALVDRDAIGLEAAARDARAAGATVTTWAVELTSPEAIEQLARDALAELGAIDVLFNNAGVAVAKPLDRTTPEDWRWVFDINVWAPIHLTRAIVPAMIARGRGQVVMMASLAGLVGAPGMTAYTTSKFAIVGFTEALRVELAPHGISTTLVCPGYVRTGLHRATRYDASPIERILDKLPTWYGRSAEQAAALIVDAVARREPQLVFGVEKLAWYVKRVWPAASFALARIAATRAGIAGRRGTGDLPTGAASIAASTAASTTAPAAAAAAGPA